MWINTSACLSPLPCENNLRYRIRKHKIPKKAKMSTPAFSMLERVEELLQHIADWVDGGIAVCIYCV